MPLFRINHDLHYFAHVPKCAGASIEVYLGKRFGKLALLNGQYFNVAEHQRWTRSSPQHIDVASLNLLIPPKWIASSFAIVRHPMTRLRSAYDYQRLGEKSIPESMDINTWLEDWAKTREAHPFRFDNHVRPANDLVPKRATVFRLEDGIDGVVQHLDQLEGKERRPRAISHENKSRGGKNYLHEQSKFSDASLALIAEIYKADFKRFGYAIEDGLNAGSKNHAKRPVKRSLTERLGLRK